MGYGNDLPHWKKLDIQGLLLQLAEFLQSTAAMPDTKGKRGGTFVPRPVG